MINSHSHADHWRGNTAFTDNDAEIITSNQVLTTIKEDGKIVVGFYSLLTNGAIGSTNTSYPTVILPQEEKRDLGGVDVEFIFSNNAHSPGNVLMGDGNL